MSVVAANSHIFCIKIHHREHQQQLGSSGGSLFLPKATVFGFSKRNRDITKRLRRGSKVEAFWPESSPAVAEMESINDTDHLDQILSNSQQPILIDWMATWCRKCIYLKPKLEKLAAEYEPKIKFYFVDVNKVPQALVKRGNISKMPTIQLWKDGEFKEEVIGGHKAWLVMEEVKEMIQKYI